MQEILAKLKALQEVDLQILELVQERDSYPAKVNALKKEIRKQEKITAQKKAAFDDISEQRASKEQLLAEEEERLKKWEKRLNESQNPREAAPLAREIDAQKRLNLESQEEVLQLAEEEERLSHELRMEEEALTALLTECSKEEDICEKKVQEFNTKVQGFESERGQYTQEVKGSLLKKYERIRDRREGIAIVAARDGRCTGCDMKLRHQLYNQIQTMSKLLTCPNCQRILFFEATSIEAKPSSS